MKSVDDWPLAIYAASLGRIHYIGRVMSCFRIGNPESITGKIGRNIELVKESYLDTIESLQKMNKATNKVYDKLFTEKIKLCDSWLLLFQKKYFKAFVKYPYRFSRHMIVIMLRKLGLLA